MGMVNLAIFTGALTTAITAAQVYDDPMMYGVEVFHNEAKLQNELYFINFYSEL